jgi:hypothetical protein
MLYSENYFSVDATGEICCVFHVVGASRDDTHYLITVKIVSDNDSVIARGVINRIKQRLEGVYCAAGIRFRVKEFVVVFSRIIYVCSKVAVAAAIVGALVFGQALHQYHHVLNSAAAAGEPADSGRCSCQTCPFHGRDTSDHDVPGPDAPHDEHDCGVCQVLLQAADPPPAIIFGDCYTPRLEVLIVASEDCEWDSLPPQSARGPPA